MLNYCTFGYTMPWWTWQDWERFIDWMALNGITTPLAATGWTVGYVIGIVVVLASLAGGLTLIRQRCPTLLKVADSVRDCNRTSGNSYCQ